MTTIREVSKIAGVSVATVSRTLSMPDKVSLKTQKKVQSAIAQTNYKPNILARNFRTRKASTIVVLVPDIANPFFSRVIRGIEQTAQKLGYAILLGDTQGLREREYTYANMVKTSQADGIIQLDCHMPFADEQDAKKFPIINVCDCMKNSDIPTIQLDNVAAAKEITEHLIQLGHQKIGLIHGPKDSVITKDRIKGYSQAIKKANLSFDQSIIVEGDYSVNSGAQAAYNLLKASALPTAIFCFNDEMAIGAIHQIKEMGFKIPEDISVAGFDDNSFAEYSDPPLTTVSQPAEDFGSRAMSMIYDVINDNEIGTTNIFLPYKLINRKSTAAIKKD
ncbi:MAG: LacI family DNA-binding transcriptional regulator [Kordiimonadaceae bacterium]|mgnify:CR=1 FL=1|jgi:LacI family transcriptional regulator, repressor for deo operon, udp, cdd, tsx, nupC, and nupG|nr:LacI family DNA-binding transcriptional regulator [Kordiimonadaceae bacterium]MBT6033564.1 LacI family DNA-binding transcriptional regulator [Kordiimonadaceae bacterium]